MVELESYNLLYLIGIHVTTSILYNIYILKKILNFNKPINSYLLNIIILLTYNKIDYYLNIIKGVLTI